MSDISHSYHKIHEIKDKGYTLGHYIEDLDMSVFMKEALGEHYTKLISVEVREMINRGILKDHDDLRQTLKDIFNSYGIDEAERVVESWVAENLIKEPTNLINWIYYNADDEYRKYYMSHRKLREVLQKLNLWKPISKKVDKIANDFENKVLAKYQNKPHRDKPLEVIHKAEATVINTEVSKSRSNNPKELALVIEDYYNLGRRVRLVYRGDQSSKKDRLYITREQAAIYNKMVGTNRSYDWWFEDEDPELFDRVLQFRDQIIAENYKL